MRRRDTQVHHIVYDLDSRPTWELNVSLAASQAGERWRIPRPAEFVHRNWDVILPPESSKRGKKRAGSGAGGLGGEPVLKQATREHTDASIEAVAAEAAGSSDTAPLERVLADIRHAKGVFMEMLAQRRAADGLQRQSAPLALRCLGTRLPGAAGTIFALWRCKPGLRTRDATAAVSSPCHVPLRKH